MMRPILLLALTCGLALPGGVARASDASLPVHDAARVEVVAAHRAVARNAAEVARLKRSVAEQEARSRQASQQLRTQDQTLEHLRQELQAAGVSDEAAATGP